MKTPQSLLQSLMAQGRDLLPSFVLGEVRSGGREFTIDELAREAGTTVRNVRAYQDRGLLAPPERRGRAGVYHEAHLARLTVIGQLLERGFTIANIKELLEAWEKGRDLDHVLGLETAILGEGWAEAPGYTTPEEMAELFGSQMTQENLLKAVELGIVEIEGERLRVPSPRLLQAAKQLIEVGVSMDKLLRQMQEVREVTDRLTGSLVDLVADPLFAPFKADVIPRAEDVQRVALVIESLRPLAEIVVNAEMAKGLKRHANVYIGSIFKDVLERYEVDIPQGRPKG
jgi:DNA-binding transcriptional MerR regulator